ncbi:MAG: hypothetical protein WAM39_22905 [Bryobacteraceae bacterium]
MPFPQHIHAALARKPFLRLIRHFAQRAVGASDTATEVDLGIGGALAILALPGAFTALGLADKYGSLMQWLRGQLHFDPYRASITDEYFFIVYSMAVAGFVTILRWDHLLPGRRDFVNLAPLPLNLRSIFLANAAALASTALLFAIDVNLFSGFFFPLLVTIQGGSIYAYFAYCGAHWAGVLGISLFTMLAVLALQGLLMALLPDVAYRRISLMFRAALLVFFFALLVSALVFPLSAFNFGLGSRMAGEWWPPIWFLSMVESFVPRLKQYSMMGAGWAVKAMLYALSIAAVSFALSYRRYFLRIAERPDGTAQPSRARWIRLEWFDPVLKLWLRSGAELATFRFIVKTLLRSETHLLFVGLWAGIGLLLSLEGLTGARAAIESQGAHASAILAAPLIFSFALVAGLRFVFDIPAAIESNWIFRLSATEGAIRLEELSRKAVAFFTVPPLMIIWYPLAGRSIGWMDATLALGIDLLLLSLGIDLLLMGFQKIPFTCSFTANRDRMLRLLLTCLGTLVFVIPILVRIETSIVLHPLRLMIWGPLLIGAAVAIRTREHARQNNAVFEDRGVEAFALLRLSGD